MSNGLTLNDEALPLSDNLLHLIINNLGEGVAVADTEGRFLLVNPKALEIWGKHPKGVKPERWAKDYGIYYPDEVTPFPAGELAMVKAINGIATQNVKIFIRNVLTPEGKHISVTGTPIRNAAGETIAGVVVMRDETAEYQIQKSLIESEERYHKMVTEIEDYAILLLDRNGIISNWNRGAEKIKGYTADEIVGRNFNTFYTETDRANHLSERLLKEAVEKGKASAEGWRVRKDGSLFWAYSVITSIHDKDGEVLGFAKITRDLTERKAAEEKLRSANKELESFAYTVAHDLRTPLRAIHGYTTILSRRNDLQHDEETRRLTNEILTNARRMNVLIDELLTFSQLGKQELTRTTINMAGMARTVSNELQGYEQQRVINFIINELPTVCGDNATINQVWLNLISNAIKYTRTRRPAIIEIGCQEAEDEIVYFIKDNGIGFDMRFINKLFGVFERLHNNEEYEGTGVGLAIVRRIIERHGGRVWATGELNQGATFYFSLPK